MLREQTERMTQMTKTLLEMSELRTVSCADRIEIGPMVEEIFTDLAPLAEKNNVTLESTGDAVMTGSDTLIYRLLYNLTENAIRYNRFDGTVNITVTHKDNQLVITVADTGYGIPEQYRESIFQPSFVWINPEAENTAELDWDFLWCGKSLHCTMVKFVWKRVRKRVLQ